MTSGASRGADRDHATLVAAVAELAERLRLGAGLSVSAEGPTRRETPAQVRLPKADTLGEGISALESLAVGFGLTAFERDVVVAGAGMELDGAFAECIVDIAGEQKLSLALLLGLLPEAHLSATSPERPLRRWGLMELSAGWSLLQASLRIDERVLHHLLGLDVLDPRLPLQRVEASPTPADPSLRDLLDAMDCRWVLSLAGPREAGKLDVLVGSYRGPLLHMSAEEIPMAAAERRELARLVSRELRIRGAALYLDAEQDPNAEDLRRSAAFVDDVEASVVVAVREGFRGGRKSSVTYDVARPSHDAQRDLWRTALGSEAEPAAVDRVLAQFDFGAAQIAEAAQLALGSSERLSTALWTASRAVSRRRLDDLAQHIVPSSSRGLVLPDAQRGQLEAIARHARHRAKVLGDWGFSARMQRGLGNTALFHGPSGTGKTLAAEMLAAELELDLYRVDLSQVVSKYIGETEKNLRRVFDAADDGGAILLFDEADALFGKRTEQQRDSHDRYANLEVGYLLQRMEAYRGLAILTTNLKKAMDTAFMRRIRFVVSFPFPGPRERAAIWRGIFPAETPVRSLDFDKLAELAISGGSIALIAMNAAFIAADQKTEVGMEQVMAAARAEYAKLEWPMAEPGAQEFI